MVDMIIAYTGKALQIKEMDVNKRGAFKHTVEMQSTEFDHLKILVFAYKDVDVSCLDENDLTLVGIVGLKNTCCTKTIDAISACQKAGVKIILASEDDVSVLENMAHKCGLIMLPISDKLVLEGKDIRNLTEKKRMDLVDKISVMGNSHPSDRLLLVQCLNKKGNVVAVVGNRTTASAMLKEADVGVAMGISSSEMARESSDIIVRNGNFSLLPSLISHGRCTYNNILKYIQLELTMIVSGTLISFITIVSLVDVPIAAIQLILANFIVNLVGGFALLSEPPTDELMNNPPISPTETFSQNPCIQPIEVKVAREEKRVQRASPKSMLFCGCADHPNPTVPIDTTVKLTTSFIKFHTLFPQTGSTSFSSSILADSESSVSSILELSQQGKTPNQL
ncbi:calcium-transporting ATPase 12, plasma membrane-type [Ziziphus jujuba]|uniref:Calcium-transporting ATPase 12, plasma membrane-type n=1 Tax=Ziziphus jujuba TaxID=326968 RepID=A0ABM3IJM2_ZIZJJ|nr:calcium-transporting ATPase 12, plasma membrane-type [Ziziphus jujuba]